MSSIKVSALTEITSTATDDVIVIVDTSAGTTNKIKVSNLPDTDTVYTLPTSTASVLGGVKVGTNLSIASGVLSATDTDTVYTHPNHSGDVVSTADGATTIQVDAVDIAMLSATGTASATTFLRGDNTWVVPTDTDTNTNQLTTFTVSATTDTTATTISQGDDLMFTAGTGITCETTADGTVTISNTVTDTDTTYTATGLLSIDGSNVITTTANNYTHPTGDGNIHVPAYGSSTSGQLLTSTGTSSTPTWQAAPQGVSNSKLFYFGSFT